MGDRRKKLLFSTGFGNIWLEQETRVYPEFIETFSQRLKDIYLQNWQSKISLSSKCDTYRLFKNIIHTELYLSCLNVKKYRICLSRFRCSCHELQIEKGRYVNIPREQRICKLCNLNVTEDEYHFLLVCPIYNNLRKKYIKEKYYVNPNAFNFSRLLKTSNVEEIKNLSIYIFHAFVHRSNIERHCI